MMREEVQNALTQLTQPALYNAGEALFSALGLQLAAKTRRALPLQAVVKEDSLGNRAVFEAVTEVYFLGQVTEASFGMFKPNEDFDEALKQVGKSYKGIWLFAIQLSKVPTRTELATLTRTINQGSKSVPVVVLFRYENGDKTFVSLAATERLAYKQEWRTGEKIGKISLLKDINPLQVHAGHLRILEDLQISEGIFSFDKLIDQWRKVFDIQTLNKQFYKDLSFWYFDAVKNIRFIGENDDKTRSVNTIKIVSRLIFLWFLKEKGLISEKLFNKEVLPQYLKSLDAESNSFYIGILSNLFFKTVNEKIEYRFKDFDILNELFFKDFEAAKIEFNRSPFVNGGLFDPSDTEICKTVEHTRQLQIPNKFFFGTHKSDLHEELNDKKSTNVEVKGLIDILNSYKFTVEENTPLESEVALDPELLGKIFENLLASYNEETKTSARKATGSYYTPREIVEYMVDQSLIAYLENKIFPDDTPPQYQNISAGFGKTTAIQDVSKANSKPVQRTLEDMFREEAEKTALPTEKQANTNEKEAFKSELTKLLRFDAGPSVSAAFKSNYEDKILDALDTVKILDPAVGSGAFPMGILQKITLLLERIDPNNERWLARMLARISNTQLRKATAEKWKHENTQYLRKLGIIENAIYGIDIQPVAVQIAKLRFFIALVIEQDINTSPAQNYGIQPLPNLDFKFVCANTLIDVPSVASDFLKADLLQFQNNVSDYFSAVGSEKKEVKKRIEANIITIWQRNIEFLAKWEKLRGDSSAKKMKNLEKQKAELAQAANLWATYTNLFKDEPVGFFNMQYFYPSVFEQGGFDIVIGNPPYVQIQKMTEKDKNILEKQQYLTYSKSSDIYCLFYENGWKNLRNKGILCFITSNSWLKTKYGENLRDFFTEHTNPLSLINFEDVQVFSSAIVESNILLFQKSRWLNYLKTSFLKNINIETPLFIQIENQTSVISELGREGWSLGNNEETNLKKIIKYDSKLLSDLNISINYGIKTGLNEAFIVSEKVKDELISQDIANTEVLMPILGGKDLKKYQTTFSKQWIIISKYRDNENFIKKYPYIVTHLWYYKQRLENRGQVINNQHHWIELDNNPTDAYLNTFHLPKIIWGELSDKPKFTYDDKGYYLNNSIFYLIGEDLKYLLGILNSKLSEWYFRQISTTSGMGTTRWIKHTVSLLPIKSALENNKKQIEQMVDYILYLKSHPLSSTEEQLMPVYFEQVIDGMVYELYFETELKAAKVDVLAHLGDLPPLSNFETDESKMTMLKTVFQRLYDPRGEVRNRLTFMRNVKEIAIIEGKK